MDEKVLVAWRLSMLKLKIYREDMQQDIEFFYKKCFTDLGWGYEPDGRHSDIVNINEVYMKNGCMWCLYDDEKLVGTIAIRALDKANKVAEMKRLYVLKDYQGRGFGRQLFEVALAYAKEKGYEKICLDTRKDRDASLHLIHKYGFVEISKYNNNEFAELFFERKL
jgi:putative acetyltransferase